MKFEMQIQSSLHQLESYITAMSDELALAPKPIRRYRRVVGTLQRLLDLLTGLRKIRENIPQKESVADVFKERRDFMSAFYISLFACEHAFHARTPIPQFLPSCRQLYSALEAHVEMSLRQAQESPSRVPDMGLAVIYGYAEMEAMKEMVDVLDELLQECRQVFGTSTWLPPQMSMGTTMAWEMGMAFEAASFPQSPV